MAKINLDFGTKRALGKHLPSIMINSVAIENRGTAGASDPTGTGSTYGEADDLIITANLIINITKPKDMQDPAAWVAEYLGDLYLYAYVSGFESLNTTLENKNFFLKDLQAAYSVPNRKTFNSSTPGFSVIHEYMKEAFITHEWYGWSGDTGTQIRDAYSAAEESELAAGLADPNCIWYYLFYGNYGPTGPWWGSSGWSGSGLDSTKTLYSDILHSSEITYDFETADAGSCFMKGFLDNYLYFLTGVQQESAEHTTVNLLAQKIPLRDFLTDTEPNKYGANFFIQNVYDQEGNELIQISNINVKFEYGIHYTVEEYADGTTYDYSKIKQRLIDTDKLFFIGTIGVDTDAIGIEETPRSIYNSFFGNISYEHILDNNEVPTQYVETFHISDTGSPYDEIPLVNLDGRYHVIEPVGHDVIVSKVQSLIDVYEHRKKDQYSLQRNIETLEGIIETYKKSPTILRMLAAYHQSYSPQDASRPAGWFYNDFTNLLTNLSKRVGYQHRLDKRMTRVGIVTDYRAMAINETYYPPSPKVNSAGENIWNAGTGDYGSDDFIPSKWSRMARMTLMADLISDDPFPGYGSDNEQFRQDIWRDLESSGHIEAWLDSGFTMEDIEAWVEATTGQMTLREGSAWIDGDTASAGIDDMHDPFGLARLQDYDYIVKNSGHFWFDWEKALYTQSNIAQIIPLNKLGRYFRMRVPYKYFPLLECKMTREELDLKLGLDEDPGKADWLNDTHTVVLKTVLSGDQPGIASQTLSYEVSPIVDPSDYAYGFPEKKVSSLRSIYDPDARGTGAEGGIYTLGTDRSWYPSGYDDPSLRQQGEDIWDRGLPAHLAGDFINLTEVTAKSYLKFVMADSAINIYGRAHVDSSGTEHSAAQDTLIGYGFAPPGVSGSATGYSTVPTDNALTQGYRVRNGYRLMGFEYVDLMDDDVAFYNTMAYSDSDSFESRQRALEEFNSLGESNSEYKVEIKVKDKTLAFYTEVFWPFIKDSYEDFYEYYLFAEEFCSFNNLNGQFNKFFVDAINERYADSSEKRWVRGALVATLLKEILYRSFEYAGPESELDLRALMEDEVMKIINNISPEEGNLQALRMFNCRFGKYLLQVNPHADFFREFCADSEDPQVYNRALDIAGLGDGDTFEGDASLWESLRDTETDHDFANHLQIDSVIYGDYLLNAQLESDISFGKLSSHPLGIPPMHLYLTAGPAADASGGYSFKNRILVYAHGMHSTDTRDLPRSIRTKAGIPSWSSSGESGRAECGWFYLENLINIVDGAEYTGMSTSPFAITRAMTPILLDLGQAAITNDATGETRVASDPEQLAAGLMSHDTAQFTAEMFMFVTNVNYSHTASDPMLHAHESLWSGAYSSEEYGSPSEWDGESERQFGRFTFVILDDDLQRRLAARADTPGSWMIIDPIIGGIGADLFLGSDELRELRDRSRTISLTELAMGDSIEAFGAGMHEEIGAWTVSELAGTSVLSGLWFPNWCTLPTAWDGAPSSEGMILTDWRLFRAAFATEPAMSGMGEDEAIPAGEAD
jgi:hypothetical protein